MFIFSYNYLSVFNKTPLPSLLCALWYHHYNHQHYQLSINVAVSAAKLNVAFGLNVDNM